MYKFRFKSFRVYEDTRQFRKELKSLSKKKFPREEQFALTSQLWRALDSIVLNIAEGADRGTDKDFAKYLNNSNTSLNEVAACLDLALDDTYITLEEHTIQTEKAAGIANQLTALRKRLIEHPIK